jgi:hypothetical protein
LKPAELDLLLALRLWLDGHPADLVARVCGVSTSCLHERLNAHGIHLDRRRLPRSGTYTVNKRGPTMNDDEKPTSALGRVPPPTAEDYEAVGKLAAWVSKIGGGAGGLGGVYDGQAIAAFVVIDNPKLEEAISALVIEDLKLRRASA